jgi:hypothetical protein
MKLTFLFSFFSLILITSCDNRTEAEKLLDNAIAYHDPNQNWNSFNGELQIRMETPTQSDRNSDILINLPEDYFYVKAVRDSITVEYEVSSEVCEARLNGSTNYSDEDAKKHRLSCENAKRYKNYYTYLYGLPMKLKDPGTHISETVERKSFKGKDYLILKVTYDKEVGTDIWYFYFDPETYAMEVYQFFRQDENGNQKDETGEYILLTEEAIVNDIKMPKIRAWYYNKDDKYLGTDILN